MGKKPLIGITAGFVKKNDFMQGPYVHEDYIRSVALAGGVPLVLPFGSDSAAAYSALCDGFVLSGGSDIDPRFYAEEPLPQIQPFVTERDRAELELLRCAIDIGKPILGVCRGFQLMNVALGGNLFQDLETQTEHNLMHAQRVERMKPVHSISILPDSRLAQLFDGQEKVYVNSLHHQAVKTLAADLKAVAFAADGVIEAAEHRNNVCINGVQWHPESMTAAGDRLMRRLFERLIRQSSAEGCPADAPHRRD
ncbi:MAG: gamma-glutamyl-gamma-aminobutyrate hydrolase family protein [Sporolactobacillus sp.]